MAVQDVELIAGFYDHQFAGSGNTKQTSIHPYGRAEKVSADPLLIFDCAITGFEASEYSAVGPEPNAISDRDAGWHIGHGFLYLISEFGLPPAGWVARL